MKNPPASEDNDGSNLQIHRSLDRQLRLHKLTVSGVPTLKQWHRLLNEVSSFYNDNDNDREILERAIEVSSTEMQALNARLTKQASTDAMTGLLNRSSLMKELDKRLTLQQRGEGAGLGVLFIDLDGFKLINDRLGHAIGDNVLCIVAERLSNCLRENDNNVVARLGGDEFVVLAPDLPDANMVVKLANRVISALSQSISLPNHPPIGVGASVGVTTVHSGEDTNAERLLYESDLAMYSAKMNGRNRVVPFTPGLDIDGTVCSRTDELRNAIVNRQLVLYFQPLVCLEHERVVGMEALVRWEHPERGVIPPDEFIPLAESSGLIHDLTRFVLEQSFQALSKWPEELFVSVNLSPKDLAHTDIASLLQDQLNHAGIDTRRVVLEITESSLVSCDSSVLDQLQSMIDTGINLAIDDFGSGYSSLSQLIDLPIQIVKLDRKFIEAGTENGASKAVVQTVIELARILGLTVVAEGIETADQAQMLRELGCDLGQGYFYSRPVPVPETSNAGCHECEFPHARLVEATTELSQAS